MEPKFFFAKVKSINEQEKTLDAVASTSDLDRDNERILPSAFKDSIESFKANPVILAGHQHRLPSGSSPVIGSAIPESIQIGVNDVTFKMRFAETPLGNEYWQLYRDKHMRAFSVGFIPLEWKDERDKTVGDIRNYTKIELLEISAVPVPSNRSALARAKGFFDTEDTKDAIAEVVRNEFTKLQSFIEISLDEIKSLLIADPDGLSRGLLLDEDLDELPDQRGDENNIEHQFERIQNSFKESSNANK